MKIKLKKAIKHRGENIEILDIPLENLTGNDLIEIEEQLKREKNLTIVSPTDSDYAISLAARAGRIPVEVLKNMPIGDFVNVITKVRIFLNDSVSSEKDETTEIPETLPEISSGV